MPGSLLGTEVVRVEDPELLEGRGTFIGNLTVPGLLHVSFVRSPHAHALVTGIDVSDAERLPGVVATFTHADLDLPAFHSFGMALNPACARPALADGKVRFVGEPVVAVVAETVAQAEDAAETVVVDYQPLPAVVDPEAALAEGAPIQFDELGSNLAAGQRDHPGIEPLADAAVVVRGRFVNQRIAVVPMEGNAISVIPAASGGQPGRSGADSGDGGGNGDGDGSVRPEPTVPEPTVPELTVYVSTQMPHLFRRLATSLLGLPEDAMRVITPHVGGGFGGKAGIAAEHLAVLGIARRLGRPVRWVETRSENMVALPHGRSQIQYIEMGFDEDGHITGMHAHIVGDAGAYAGFGGGLAMGPTRAMAQGVYRIPKIAYDVAVALTNTTPVGAFRGAGRPEAAAFLERIMDLAADELGIDPVEIRRRNLLGPDVFPYTTLMGTTYDIGDYALPLERAVERAGYERLLAEQAERRARGDRWQLGIGVSTYVEITAGGSASEYGSVAVGEDGVVTVSAGTSAHGQGHATSFAMLVADRLHVPLESIRYLQSDTDVVPRGGGTGGSRSLQIGGTAVYTAAGAVVERARRLAARLLEADVDDIVVGEDGRVGVAGVPARALTWAELAQAAARHDDGDGPLAAALDTAQDGATFPFGAHVAVVEVDLETGAVHHLRHVAVDDCGRIVNPLLVRGQQHGGIAQGVAQALWEQFVYDEDGNPITSTLAEYAMPSAAELPSFETENTETPTPLNPLGAKGIGESGTIGSMPAVQNAVVDALSHLGVRHLEMPCTPERVWRAINEAAAGSNGSPWREPPAFFDTLPERGARPTPAAADVDI